MTLDSEFLARRLADLALDRKARDVVVLDVRGLASYTDFLVLASGTSDRHVQSVAEFVTVTMKQEHNLAPVGQEGLREGQWALIDFGDAILHVFHVFTREVYALQELWANAPVLHIENPTAQASNEQR
jgi:ribosome-associated protein